MDNLDQISALRKLGIELYLPNKGLVYKYCSFETSLKIIKSNSLMFSRSTEFNDPFDMTNSLIDKSCTEQELYKWIEGMSKSHDPQRKKAAKEYLKNPSNLYSLLDQALTKLKNDAGISCFSKSHKKTLMWSHYADKHKGVCLGFKFLPTAVSDNLLVMSVNYINSIKPINFFRTRNIVLLYWTFTKSHVWAYEEEVRAIISNQTGIISFDRPCLTEVYFGLKTTTQEKEQIIKLLKDNKYDVSKISYMTIDPNTFDLAENKYGGSVTANIDLSQSAGLVAI